MKKSRLLIIDDQPDVRAEVKERIESMGHEADEASCQEEALRKIQEIQYDCALLDLAIPLKQEGVAQINHGKNLLQQIVAMPDPPPVIIITSNGLAGHKLAVEMMEIGAKSFVAKPFDGGELEPKIQQVLGGQKNKSSAQNTTLKPFDGGALVVSDDGIELCDIRIVVRVNAIIRGVVECLSSKKHDKYLKVPAKVLAKEIPGSPNPQSITAAISDFRNQCVGKLAEAGIKCDKDAVIQTANGGGYQLREWIQVRLGSEGEISTRADEDCAQVMRAFSRNKKQTPKQVREAVKIPAVRVQAVIAKLEERGKLKNVRGSGSTTTYESIS